MANFGLQNLPLDLSRIALRQATRTWMLQRKYMWQVFMPASINNVFGHLVSPYCQDASFGPYGLSDITRMQHGAFLRFYSGLQAIRSASLTFLLQTDNSVLEYFHGWYDLMISKEGYYYPKLNYAKTIYISLYDVSGIEAVKFTLKGTFPVVKPFIDLSYAANDVQRVVVPLSVDNVEMTSMSGSVRGFIAGAVGGILGEALSSVVGGVSATTLSGVAGAATAQGLNRLF